MILEKYCILGQALLQKITLTFPSKRKYTDQQPEATSTLFHILSTFNSTFFVPNGPVK